MAGTSVLDSSQFAALEVHDLELPKEGSRGIPLLLDFTAYDSYTADLLRIVQQGFMSQVQAVFVDLSGSDVALTVTLNGTNQVIFCKPRTQGYYQVLCTNPPRLVFTCAGGPAGVKVFLLNSPIPGAVWATQ